MEKRCPLFVLLLILLALSFARAQASAPRGLLKPLKTATPPVIDGILNDQTWSEAPSVTGFKTWTPDFGLDMHEETVAYMAYDSENLYFALQCFDREPAKIKAAVSRRDDMRTDDWICLNLDSFNDQQSLYALYVNPLGIQGDSRFASGKEDLSVDIIWYSAGKIHDQGYSVEVQVPLKSIRYSTGERTEMGIAFERRISRFSENGTYPPLDPAKGFFWLTQLAPMEYFGLKKYTLLEILPAFTYHQKYSQTEGALNRETPARDLSLTGKCGLTPSLILDGTVNPDFSQVEADAGQVDVNLRYDLYFPEKRPFFLEGSENFNLAGSTEEDFLQAVVYTRNIVDPRVGFKLTGKVTRKDKIALIFAADEYPATYGPLETEGKYAYFSILRYRHALAQDSFLGFFFTDREHHGRFNRVVGPDGQVRLNQSSMLSFHVLGSFTQASREAERTNGHALSVDYLYDTRNLKINLGAQDLGEDFETDSGYLMRAGLSRFRAMVSPLFYPRSQVLRRIDLTLASSQLRDHPSDIWETNNTLALDFLLVRSTRLYLAYTYSTEIFLSQKFNTSGWQVYGQSQITKQLDIRLLFREGKAIRYAESPFQGYGKSATAKLTYQPSEKINWTLSYTYSDLFRDASSEKIYDYTIVRNRLTYQVNKYLFFRGVVESNSYRKQLLTEFLASFTYIPGTVIHLGYGALYNKIRWEAGDYIEADGFLEMKRGFFFKASYLWRF